MTNTLLPEELETVPTFMNTKNCDPQLISKCRELLSQRFRECPDNFYDFDVQLLMNDDWTVSRFLLRCRLDPKRSVALMEDAGKFRRQLKMGEAKPRDFPSEIFQVGAVFKYEPDRVGNVTLWMRVRFHRRSSSEMNKLMRSYLMCILDVCDRQVNGRGVAVIFDLTACGLKNADPSFLYWLISSFRNFCPKGLSYILVYNLPWVMSATCSLALSWLSSTNRKRLRFIEGSAIHEFIAPENLPDFVIGGCCKSDYKCVPKGSVPAKAQPDHPLVPMTEKLVKRIQDLHKTFTTGRHEISSSDEETPSSKEETPDFKKEGLVQCSS